MIPMFTAESALKTSGGQHAALPRAAYAAGVVPQQMNRLEAIAPDGLGNELAPATCTCPCCQKVGNRLVCC